MSYTPTRKTFYMFSKGRGDNKGFDKIIIANVDRVIFTIIDIDNKNISLPQGKFALVSEFFPDSDLAYLKFQNLRKEYAELMKEKYNFLILSEFEFTVEYSKISNDGSDELPEFNYMKNLANNN